MSIPRDRRFRPISTYAVIILFHFIERKYKEIKIQRNKIKYRGEIIYNTINLIIQRMEKNENKENGK